MHANSAYPCDLIFLGYWILMGGAVLGAVLGVFVAGVLDHFRSLHFVGRSDGYVSDTLQMSSQHA